MPKQFIPPPSPSSQSPEAGTIGQKWPQCRVDPAWTPSPNIQIKKEHSAEMSGENSVKISMDIKVSFLKNGRPGYEADGSSPSSADVRNVWKYTSILPHTIVFK
jgi:hypothetical protein